MLKQTIEFIAAPTGIQPGGYVPRAYADRTQPATPSATLEAERSTRGWRFRLAWPCPQAVRDTAAQSDLFPDAAAIIAATVPDTPLATMGAPGKPIEGYLWRADRETLLSIRAEGLGTVQREEANSIRRVSSEWKAAEWSLAFEVAGWRALDETHQLAVAVWRGSLRERAGLKSISPGWIEIKI